MLIQRITGLAMTAVLLLGGSSELMVAGLTGGPHCTGTVCYCPKKHTHRHGASPDSPMGHQMAASGHDAAAGYATWCPGSRHCELRQTAQLPPQDTVPAILAGRAAVDGASPIAAASTATRTYAPDADPTITTPPPRA